MGSEAHVVVVGDDAAEILDLAREDVEALEARWSRFRDDSEVSRLNAAAGAPVVVSEETLLLVRRAIAGWRVTGGRYDPTVLGAMLRAGYDRDLPARRAAPHEPVSPSTLHSGCAEIVLDEPTRLVWMPVDVGFDPGGIGKGLAADLVAARALARGARGVSVNLGGDVRVSGPAPGGEAWRIDVLDPWDSEPMARVVVRDGAVATSSRTRRVWTSGGEVHHHLVDPGSGGDAASGLAQVTVVAAEGWRAEVLAKGAFVAGVEEGLELLECVGAQGLLVDDDGGCHETAGWTRFAPLVGASV
jgi:thiamine biosynthesis lipoprotein